VFLRSRREQEASGGVDGVVAVLVGDLDAFARFARGPAAKSVRTSAVFVVEEQPAKRSALQGKQGGSPNLVPGGLVDAEAWPGEHVRVDKVPLVLHRSAEDVQVPVDVVKLLARPYPDAPRTVPVTCDYEVIG